MATETYEGHIYICIYIDKFRVCAECIVEMDTEDIQRRRRDTEGYIYGRFSIEYIHIEERHRKYIVGNIYHLDERIAI